jgi:hypothetical protein
MSAGISDPTRPDAARELGGLQIIDNRPLAVSLLRPDEFSRLDPAMLNGNPYNGQQISGVRVSNASTSVSLSGAATSSTTASRLAQT